MFAWGVLRAQGLAEYGGSTVHEWSRALGRFASEQTLALVVGVALLVLVWAYLVSDRK